MSSKVKIEDSWDQLTKDSVTASNMGISYGQLMAQRFMREGSTKKAEPEKKKGQHICRNCGIEIRGIRSGRAKFCSIGCREEYRDKHGKLEETLYCINCGKELTGNRTSYCSKECSDAVQKAKKKEMRCLICGIVITEPNRRKYCCAEHNRLGQQIYQKAYREGKPYG